MKQGGVCVYEFLNNSDGGGGGNHPSSDQRLIIIVKPNSSPFRLRWLCVSVHFTDSLLGLTF